MFNIDFLDIAIIVTITAALVNFIKQIVVEKTGKELGQWYLLISAGVGAAIFAVGLYAPDIVKSFIAVGLVASGLYVYKKTL